jgi:hypothetical protein
VTSQDKHVSKIEHQIWTNKEPTQAIYNTLTFDCMPVCLVVEMVYAAIFWLNRFPGSSQISDTLSPREIVLRQSLDYKKHCRRDFWLYLQMHEQHDNSMAPWTVGALALRTTGNVQDSHFFFSLLTGNVLNRSH